MDWLKKLIAAAGARPPATVSGACNSCYEDDREEDYRLFEEVPAWHNGFGIGLDYCFPRDPKMFDDGCDISSPDICWSAPTI